ncbi:TetR/AcrR family transcriptional regulator [Mycobacterium sp. DL440]|uniref:TetR/AcrR family transcriptional regulator n=1 Tax=Mycobacterium sp. DL440 TaxID=2675523 RepID=UPI00141F3AE2|nr:TetR/AcrR family transcriptional regulator [Mycobacterium sp. DL440]
MTEGAVKGVGPWGTDMPQDEGQARARLLAAAETCYTKRGVARTTIVDIAREAGVHRSTVYAYFQNKDEVLAACFVQATRSVLDAAESCFHTGEPFLEQLIRATVVGLATARESSAVMLLLGDDQVGRTYRAAEASEAWRGNLMEFLGDRIAAAVTTGEVRDDVAVETMARWVTRLAFSLVQEPCSAEDGGDEALLCAFLPGALAARS